MEATPVISPSEQAGQTPGRYPSVVITLPFEPALTPKHQLDTSLKAACSQAERQLLSAYSRHMSLTVTHQLEQLIHGLNFSTHKKSIALLASPETAKILYLDIPVDTQVLVDADFHIRDLAAPVDTNVPYLVLLLSGHTSKMFHFDGAKLKLIKSNTLRSVYAYMHQLPEKVANFTDTASMKEQLLDKFLHHMDQGLSIILEAYSLPVFVIGTDKVVGHFSSITHNARQIAVYIHKNCMRATEADLDGILRPYLDNWRIIRQQMALKHIELALETGKLTSGLEAVSNSVNTHNNRLLIVEKNFTGAASQQQPSDGSRQAKPAQPSQPFYIAAPVDSIIEKVLACGGQVEWVDEGQLEDQGHIALVRYY